MNNRFGVFGFTLIEVLLALAIIAIAFSALLKATSSSIVATQTIQDKLISHWVKTQAVSLIQLGLIDTSTGQPINEKTTLFNQTWYWRASLKPSLVKSTQEITINVSKHERGPFGDPFIAYVYMFPPDENQNHDQNK